MDAIPAPVAADGVRRWRAAEYAIVPGHRPLLADVARPDHERRLPLVVFVHGGGWRAGSRTSMGPAFAGWDPDPFAELAAAGFVVASVDYRLSGEAVFPAPLDDLRAALAWLAAHGDAFGAAPGPPALWGESAGAHLAALAALTGTEAAAVIDWYGPSDLLALVDDAATSPHTVVDPGAADSREALLLGGAPPTVPDRARAASPAHHAHPAAPPFLIAHGTADRFVPVEQSRRFAHALNDAGVPVDLRLVEGADHLWLGDPATARMMFGEAVAFLREHLPGAP